jgi:hypothetical protein
MSAGVAALFSDQRPERVQLEVERDAPDVLRAERRLVRLLGGGDRRDVARDRGALGDERGVAPRDRRDLHERALGSHLDDACEGLLPLEIVQVTLHRRHPQPFHRECHDRFLYLFDGYAPGPGIEPDGGRRRPPHRGAASCAFSVPL